ncbi:hypothetical protein M3Y95_00282300 [Aphelenchoides besseyi]|nr:hypothetical protein M3Y95_00282300 [Aphelenchoides besseyi]
MSPTTALFIRLCWTIPLLLIQIRVAYILVTYRRLYKLIFFRLLFIDIVSNSILWFSNHLGQTIPIYVSFFSTYPFPDSSHRWIPILKFVIYLSNSSSTIVGFLMVLSRLSNLTMFTWTHKWEKAYPFLIGISVILPVPFIITLLLVDGRFREFKNPYLTMYSTDEAELGYSTFALVLKNWPSPQLNANRIEIFFLGLSLVINFLVVLTSLLSDKELFVSRSKNSSSSGLIQICLFDLFINFTFTVLNLALLHNSSHQSNCPSCVLVDIANLFLSDLLPLLYGLFIIAVHDKTRKIFLQPWTDHAKLFSNPSSLVAAGRSSG